MGQFSWFDCVSGKQILDNVYRDVYVLIPAEFGGGHIHESCYDGYGHFGRQDVYELVAKWNQFYLQSFQSVRGVPEEKDYGGLWADEKEALRKQGLTEDEIAEKNRAARHTHYLNAVYRHERSVQRLKDFGSGMSEKELMEKYCDISWGNTQIRCIGIDIACYDEDQDQLKYPIKITYDRNAVYEHCGISYKDPDQGWLHEDDLDEEEEWER